jgi:hypothetical protein
MYYQAIFKVFYYDLVKETEMKSYVKETVTNSERVLQSNMSAMESRILSEIKTMEARRGWGR